MQKVVLAVLRSASAGCGWAWADGTPREGLTKLNIPHTEITGATLITGAMLADKGAFTSPAPAQPQATPRPAKTYNDVRLIMVPEMGHRQGGDRPNTFDKLDVISDWVKKGNAPDQIIASPSTAGKVDRMRPLRPYPRIANYKSSGSIDEAQNFVCAAP